MEKFMIDEGLDRALDIICKRIDYYKKEDNLILDDIIIEELEMIAKEIEDQKYYK